MAVVAFGVIAVIAAIFAVPQIFAREASPDIWHPVASLEGSAVTDTATISRVREMIQTEVQADVTGFAGTGVSPDSCCLVGVASSDWSTRRYFGNPLLVSSVVAAVSSFEFVGPVLKRVDGSFFQQTSETLAYVLHGGMGSPACRSWRIPKVSAHQLPEDLLGRQDCRRSSHIQHQRDHFDIGTQSSDPIGLSARNTNCLARSYSDHSAHD